VELNAVPFEYAIDFTLANAFCGRYSKAKRKREKKEKKKGFVMLFNKYIQRSASSTPPHIHHDCDVTLLNLALLSKIEAHLFYE